MATTTTASWCDCWNAGRVLSFWRDLYAAWWSTPDDPVEAITAALDVLYRGVDAP